MASRVSPGRGTHKIRLSMAGQCFPLPSHSRPAHSLPLPALLTPGAATSAAAPNWKHCGTALQAAAGAAHLPCLHDAFQFLQFVCLCLFIQLPQTHGRMRWRSSEHVCMTMNASLSYSILCGPDASQCLVMGGCTVCPSFLSVPLFSSFFHWVPVHCPPLLFLHESTTAGVERETNKLLEGPRKRHAGTATACTAQRGRKGRKRAGLRLSPTTTTISPAAAC